MESTIQQGYHTAYTHAAQAFALADPAVCAHLCGADYLAAQASLRLAYLQQPYLIHWPSAAVRHAVTGEEAPLAVQVLLLNYVLYANGQHPSGTLIAFREIPGAATYDEPFSKRALRPLMKTFDGQGPLLLAAAMTLGGTPATVADVSVTLPILPRLPVTYGLWHGDDEFPASGVILFDASSRKLLTIECLVVAASNGVYALMKAARTLGT
ncbi:MAG TPA: DUF3786 domain-containing protein [Armatimonadota bacterium]|jgi:hypothetical protein